MTIYLEIDDDLENDQALWRYMDLSKFVSMLEKEALWLARADTFRDQHEGRFPDEMKVYIEKAYEEFDDDQDSPVKDSDDFQDYIIKNTFVSCWHKNFDENMVMWEIYGRDNNAVAIQTTVEKMEDSIDASSLAGHSLMLKDVIYQSSDEILGVIPYEECVFRKRPHFFFEQEVRISLDTYSRENPNKKTKFGHELPIFTNLLIERILVHPDSPTWFLNVVDSITTKYEIHAPISRGMYGTQ